VRIRGFDCAIGISVLLPFVLIVLALLLAGCGTVPAPEPVERVVIQKQTIPRAYLECEAQPKSPGSKASEERRAVYLGDLAAAGQDCRSKLGAVRGLVEPTP
jgi:hypothetical protein